MEACKEWLLRGDDRTITKCKMCPIPQNKTKLSNMGETAIRSHAKGKKHRDRLALFIQSSRINFMPVSKGSSESPGSSSRSTCSSALEKFVVPEVARGWKCKKNFESLASNFA